MHSSQLKISLSHRHTQQGCKHNRDQKDKRDPKRLIHIKVYRDMLERRESIYVYPHEKSPLKLKHTKINKFDNGLIV